MIVFEIATRRLASALSEMLRTRDAVQLHPKVGQAFMDQLRAREEAEAQYRKAFREVTGMTLVRRRGGIYGVRY